MLIKRLTHYRSCKGILEYNFPLQTLSVQFCYNNKSNIDMVTTHYGHLTYIGLLDQIKM